MIRFSRFLRAILLPVAVLATVAGSSASASAATLEVNVTTNNSQVTVTVKGPGTISTAFHPDSMNY